MNDKLIIFDTTLRDGEQSAGAAMSKSDKLKIAMKLQDLRVDVIEAGFPASSNGDFESVKTVSQNIQDCIVCALCRANKKDILIAKEAISLARHPRIHIFIASSPIHMTKKLNLSPDEVLEKAVDAVKFAKKYTDDIEFSPEDACRSEEDFLCKLLESVIDAGATTVNIPDTVGYAVPHQFSNLITQLIKRVPNSDRAIFSVHCHDDLGMATANSLSAIMSGARQIEGTINGIGERAGNAALEEVIMAVRTRSDIFECDSNIDAKQLLSTSKMVSSITGIPVQPNKAIIGDNAFVHESGIHQDGVLKHKSTYEIISAEDIGRDSNFIKLGKLSGRSAFRNKTDDLGIKFKNNNSFNNAFLRFKKAADKKRNISDNDLFSICNFDET